MTYADGYSVRSTAANLNLVANALDDLDSRISTTDWRALSETLTYASATTITIATGGASRFQKGDRLWLTQTTSKYFVIIAVADTQLTITGGSDYTLVNAAITSPYVSRSQAPFGWPTWFNWSPTVVGFSSTPTQATYRFLTLGTACLVNQYHNNNGTSNATTFTVTAPITAATVSNYGWGNVFWDAADNGSTLTVPGRVFILTAGTVITLNKDISGAAWTNANGKRGSYELWYQF